MIPIFATTIRNNGDTRQLARQFTASMRISAVSQIVCQNCISAATPRTEDTLYIEYRVCVRAYLHGRTHARRCVSLHRAVPLRSIFPPLGKAAVRWSKRAGVGFWCIIVQTITRCQPAGGAGDPAITAISPRVEREPRLGCCGGEPGEGQECVYEKNGPRSEAVAAPATDASNSACLSNGAIASPGQFSRAPHNFLPVMCASPSRDRSLARSRARASASLFCFCDKKVF